MTETILILIADCWFQNSSNICSGKQKAPQLILYHIINFNSHTSREIAAASMWNTLFMMAICSVIHLLVIACLNALIMLSSSQFSYYMLCSFINFLYVSHLIRAVCFFLKEERNKVQKRCFLETWIGSALSRTAPHWWNWLLYLTERWGKTNNFCLKKQVKTALKKVQKKKPKKQLRY